MSTTLTTTELASPRPSISRSHIDHDEGIELRPVPPSPDPSLSRTALIILLPSLINFLASFTNGTINLSLPTIAASITLPRSLYLWPSSVYGLTAGSLLLIAGSVADLIGARRVELVGVCLLGIFTLACGAAATGTQLVIFRALQGCAMALHLPSAVALVAAGVPQGRARNVGFACLGLSQVLGFSVGLVASGIMIERIGWRAGFYISGGALLVVTGVASRVLPKTRSQLLTYRALWTEIDWVGGILASGGLAILAYVLGTVSADLHSIHSASTAVLLTLSLLLLLLFPFWMNYRTRAGRPALIPNSLWNSVPFTSICIMVALAYGSLNSMELFSSLYFQEVQEASPLKTSLMLLPNLIVGAFLNLIVGFVVHRTPVRWLVTVSSLLCSIAPLLMAIVNPAWNYWLLQFWAQFFAPFSVDVLFTVGLIVVSDSFPAKTQALAGAVFSTVAQFGQSLGAGICQVVALGVVDSDHSSKPQNDLLLEGYRASFWTMFALSVVCGLVAVPGLRKAGKVGVKRE
ncbi:MFS general substrate transporter [Myriangium duriaei CBS 260.36]|uniref:MFS general substrate transporter n=1 Tax=Myriangium duriaei CBS 260.36 TaxID=1168546 RepID=A0A9P4J7T3_9PEZI|nr:MFS general substrate transporter [Myriangium duriaei CBS 260.36]